MYVMYIFLHSGDRRLAAGLQRGIRHSQDPDAADTSYSSRPGTQLLRVLLRNPQLAGARLSPGQTGLRRRHRRA